MILIVTFGLLFLVGFSLCVAVLGKSFLQKHAKRVVKEIGPKLTERDYRERFRHEYEEKLRATEAKEERVLEGVVQERPGYLLPAVTPRGGAGKWVLISLGIVIVLLFSFYFSYRQWGDLLKRPRLYFCEDVDYLKLKPINRSDTFTRGLVTVFIKSKHTIDTEKAHVSIYKIDTTGPADYYSRKIPVKPDWASFSFKTLFDRIGMYSVKVLNDNGELIAEENIFIVPDSYAYRPVLEE